MKKNILILVLVTLFAVTNVFAQKKDDSAKISEVILTTKMHCADCADKVKKQLAYTKGVVDVQANHEKDAVYVKYRNDRTDNEKLIASLKEIGYDAKVFNAANKCPHSQGGACCGNHNANHQKPCDGKAQAKPQEKAAEHKCSGNHSNCSGHKNTTK